MRKLRVLTCAYACLLENGTDAAGGEAVLGWNLVRQIARFHHVWVLTPAAIRAGIEAELLRVPLPNVSFVYVDLPRWLRPLLKFPGGVQFYAYLWQIQAYFVARKLHAQIEFEVFHHLTYANDWMASYIGALLPIPYLRGPGGGAHCTPRSFLTEYSLMARFWERFRGVGQWVLRRDPFFVRSQRRARAILLCNREAADAVPGSLKSKVQLFPVNGISAEDLDILGGRNGVGSSHAVPDQGRVSLSGAPFEVFSAGKLLGLKAHALGIRGFARFAQHRADVSFTIVGDGPERSQLEKLIQDLGLEKRVRLNRWLPRPKVLLLMRNCDAFLFPSLRDGGGAVVVEAMAAGKPVICMDLAGPGVHITEECGIKIPPRSPDDAVRRIAQALEMLYQDKELRLKRGQAARARAVKQYSWDHLGDRLFKIYEEALGASSQEE